MKEGARPTHNDYIFDRHLLASTDSSSTASGPPVSLRLGHATALTPHCGVIHYRGAASLPHRGRLRIERLRREDERTVEDAGPYKCIERHDII